MIMADHNKVFVDGNKSRLLTEFTLIIRALVNSNIPHEMIEDAYRIAFMSDEALEDEIIQKLKNIIDKTKGENDD